MRKSNYGDIEEVVFKWHSDARYQNGPLSRVSLKENAIDIDISREMGVLELSESNVCIERFCAE